MAINNSVDDYLQLNDAGTAGNWTASGFDSPTLNDSAATTPIYVENVTCMFWPLKKGTTNGYTYTSTLPATVDMTGRIAVGFVQYPFADIDAIPITLLAMRLSSSTGFTTNYRQYDALTQLASPFNIPITGFTPIMAYQSGGTESGTFDETSVESVGYVATTGNDADGKQGGFDHFFVIGYVGAHSQTFTNTFLSDLYEEWYDNAGGGLPGTADRPIAVLSQSSTFFQTNIRFALGDGTSDSANIVVSESGKTVFFNNLEDDHELGWLLNNPSGVNQLQLTLTNCTMFWNSQNDGLDIFDGVSNADIFRIDGCSFANGGNLTLAAHISDANTYVNNSSFTACRRIEPNTMLFESNNISDTAATAVDSGALLLDSTSHRVSENTISKGTGASHAIVITTAGTYSLSDMVFNGYNAANGNNDSTIRNESGGAVIINASNITGNLTYQNGTSATTTINNTVSITLAGMKDLTEVRVCDQSNPPGELAGIENATDGTTDNRSFTFSIAPATVVDITVFNVQWRLPPNNRIDDFTIPATDATIPISQVFDRNYENL